MAALVSTFFSIGPKLSQSLTTNSIPKSSATRSSRPNLILPVLACVHRGKNLRKNFSAKRDSLGGLKKLVDSLFVLCASVALSTSLILADTDPAAASLVSSPRKLQTDELATVRLFQENTPSVVYITNLAARYSLAVLMIFILCVRGIASVEIVPFAIKVWHIVMCPEIESAELTKKWVNKKKRSLRPRQISLERDVERMSERSS